MNTHGGKREGAGRKKGIETKTMRVPITLIDEIKELIRNEKEKKHLY
jgi:hypothetical protein